MAAGVAGDEVLERARHGLGERRRQPERERATECISISGRIIAGGEASLSGDSHLDRPLLRQQVRNPPVLSAGTGRIGPIPADRRRGVAAEIDLSGGEVADRTQDVVQLVGAAGPATVGQPLQVELDVGEHSGIEELAELLGSEEVAEQVAVERQRRRSPLGQWGVALVHVDRRRFSHGSKRHRCCQETQPTFHSPASKAMSS